MQLPALRIVALFSIALLTLGITACQPTAKKDARKPDKPAAGEAKQDEIDQGSEPTSAEPPAPDGAMDEPPASDAAVSGDGAKSTEVAANDTSAKPLAPDAKSSGAKVLLGSPELTAGLPGEGDLKIEEIQAWLDNPENHVELEPVLPLGLSAGQNQIKGIDKNPLTRAKIELGRQLYFDVRLSKDNTVSCSSCHHPDEGFAKHTQFGVGIGGQQGGRNSPVSYNRILSDKQFWDGRADSLEMQAVGPIANPIEMGHTHEACVSCVDAIDGYKLQFAKIFGDGVNIDNIGKAIASFERTIVTGPSQFDYLEQYNAIRKTYPEEDDLEELKSDDPELYEKYLAAAEGIKEMSESAKRGREIFFTNKGNCTACHVGPNLSDEKYHNLGVGMDKDEPDLGRFAESKDEKEKGAFKTPTIRNVALSAPYMHDGSQETLEAVVEWYAKGGHPNPHLSDKVKKLDLSDQDKKDLVEFMKATTGSFPVVEQGRLPE